MLPSVANLDFQLYDDKSNLMVNIYSIIYHEIYRIIKSFQIFADIILLLLKLYLGLALKKFGFNIVFSISVDKKKRCVIKLENPGAILLNLRIHKNKYRRNRIPIVISELIKSILSECRQRNIYFYVWGYAEKEFFGYDISSIIQTFRLEAGLFGDGPRYNNKIFSYVIDSKCPYFDGRFESDLENMLSCTRAGVWKEWAKSREIVKRVIDSNFQKYSEVNTALSLPIDENSIVMVGQCEGDAAWLETDTLVFDNVELVEKAINKFQSKNCFFKPHPFNKTNQSNIKIIKERYPVTVIDGKTSFSSIATRKPTVVVNTSGAGLEAALRGCQVHTFGTSFYSHWGFTTDYTECSRRTNRLYAEDVFYIIISQYCRYGVREPLERSNWEYVAEQFLLNR